MAVVSTGTVAGVRPTKLSFKSNIRLEVFYTLTYSSYSVLVSYVGKCVMITYLGYSVLMTFLDYSVCWYLTLATIC